MLRRKLLERVAVDQAIRDTLAAELRGTGTVSEATARRMWTIDSMNSTWLEGVVARSGWPTRASVGEEGTDAAFLLVQHARHDTAFQARMLPLLEQARARGDAKGGDVAMLTDNLAIARGRAQRYGTGARIVDGRVVFEPIEDSAHVDERRAAMGLPPLVDYRRVLDSVYAKPSP